MRKELGLFSLEKRLKGGMVTGSKHEKVFTEKRKVLNCSLCTGLRARRNCLKLQRGRFRLSSKGKFLIVRTFKQWNKLPKKFVDSPSLRVFKDSLVQPAGQIQLLGPIIQPARPPHESVWSLMGPWPCTSRPNNDLWGPRAWSWQAEEERVCSSACKPVTCPSSGPQRSTMGSDKYLSGAVTKKTSYVLWCLNRSSNFLLVPMLINPSRLKLSLVHILILLVIGLSKVNETKP